VKILIIGGNRYVGLRLATQLDRENKHDLHILNRTGQAAHIKNAAIFKGDRSDLVQAGIDREWDLIYDFAAYNYADAKTALDHFSRVGRYIFISTVSVYDLGANLKEEAFDPAHHRLGTTGEGYRFGKRQAEGVFAQLAGFPVLSVRFPVILGPDDYTRRLEFHIEHATRGETVFATDPTARFSVVHAQDAADFLHWAGSKQEITGPINVASPHPITLRALSAQIELGTGHRLKTAVPSTGQTEGLSPYSPEQDWFVDVARMIQAGFRTRAVDDWLPGLIGQPKLARSKGRMH
jgi:nucleoside-diphosphate-sugar epimerase